MLKIKRDIQKDKKKREIKKQRDRKEREDNDNISLIMRGGGIKRCKKHIKEI